MKHKKMLLGFVLILAMLAALAVTAYAASVTVKYRVYVYSDEITFRQYDYSQSTTPSITNLTISATSSLGSGSALYHMKYADGAVAYCIEPGVHSDDSGTYKEGSSASWYMGKASHYNAAGYRLRKYRHLRLLRRTHQAVCGAGRRPVLLYGQRHCGKACVLQY